MIITSLARSSNRKISHCHLHFLAVMLYLLKESLVKCLMADMLVSSVSRTYFFFLLLLSLPVRMQLFVPTGLLAPPPHQVMKQLHPDFCNHQGATMATATNKQIQTRLCIVCSSLSSEDGHWKQSLRQYLCFSFSSTRFYFASTLLLCAKKETRSVEFLFLHLSSGSHRYLSQAVVL